MNTRFAALLLCAVAMSVAGAQERRPDKIEERRLFHSIPVRSTDSATRLRGFEARQRLEQASPFHNLFWRNIGPEIQGGRVIDIKAPLGRPDDLYVAFATGGLYRTSDDGITWTTVREVSHPVMLSELENTPMPIPRSGAKAIIVRAPV